MSDVTLAALARNFGWVIEDEAAVDAVEGALRGGGKVALWADSGGPEALLSGATGRVHHVKDLGDLRRETFEAALVVTHRLVADELEGLAYPAAVIRPRDLAVGLECEAERPLEEVERSVLLGLRQSRLAWGSVARLATFEGDEGRRVLTALAEKFRLPLGFHASERIRAVSDLPDAGGPAFGEGSARGYADAAAVLGAGASSGRGCLIAPRITAGRIALAVAAIPPAGG
ncbi:MAG: cobalamin biosynthesis protein [Nitrospinota bacterium]